DWNFLIDPAPAPDLVAERAEEAADAFEEMPEGPVLPFPTLLFGTNLTPWPGPDLDVSQTCPACGAGQLPKHAYCLCCDRWGLDDHPGARPPAPPTRRTAPRTRPRTHSRQGERRSPALDNPDRDRTRRKARRKARLAVLI